MKTLAFRKVRYGWELVLDGFVIAHRVTETARTDVLLMAAGFIAGFEQAGVALNVEKALAFTLNERGFWKNKAPHANS